MPCSTTVAAAAAADAGMITWRLGLVVNQHPAVRQDHGSWLCLTAAQVHETDQGDLHVRRTVHAHIASMVLAVLQAAPSC
jgi:hypothetical protein